MTGPAHRPARFSFSLHVRVSGDIPPFLCDLGIHRRLKFIFFRLECSHGQKGRKGGQAPRPHRCHRRPRGHHRPAGEDPGRQPGHAGVPRPRAARRSSAAISSTWSPAEDRERIWECFRRNARAGIFQRLEFKSLYPGRGGILFRGERPDHPRRGRPAAGGGGRDPRCFAAQGDGAQAGRKRGDVPQPARQHQRGGIQDRRRTASSASSAPASSASSATRRTRWSAAISCEFIYPEDLEFIQEQFQRLAQNLLAARASTASSARTANSAGSPPPAGPFSWTASFAASTAF